MINSVFSFQSNFTNIKIDDKIICMNNSNFVERVFELHKPTKSWDCLIHQLYLNKKKIRQTLSRERKVITNMFHGDLNLNYSINFQCSIKAKNIVAAIRLK